MAPKREEGGKGRGSRRRRGQHGRRRQEEEEVAITPPWRMNGSALAGPFRFWRPCMSPVRSELRDVAAALDRVLAGVLLKILGAVARTARVEPGSQAGPPGCG